MDKTKTNLLYCEDKSVAYEYSHQRFHSNKVVFCLPKLSIDDAKTSYIKAFVEQDNECKQIFGKKYIENGLSKIVNVELVYVETASYNYSRSWFYNERKVERKVGTTIYEDPSSGYAVGFDNYATTIERDYYSKTKYSAARIIQGLATGEASAKKVSGENFQDLQVRIFNAPHVNNNYKSILYPIYIITTEGKKGYYYSFINGINGKYRLEGDVRKFVAKKRIHLTFNVAYALLMALVLSLVFVYFAKSYLLDDFFRTVREMLNTVSFANQNYFLEKVLCIPIGIIFFLLVVVYGVAFFAGFGFCIALIVSSISKTRSAYGKSYICSRNSNSYNFNIARGFSVGELYSMYFLKPLLCALIFAAGFGIMFLWQLIVNSVN